MPLKHGGKGTLLYRRWQGMKDRCYNPANAFYHRYGKRGISVCPEWVHSFATFKEWAEQNGYKEELSLDRINNDGNYEPSNCRWATSKQQSRNYSRNLQVTAFGETKTAIEWASDARCAVKSNTLYQRLEVGWLPETAITRKSQMKKET